MNRILSESGTDLTEAVRVVYDALYHSLDWGSGFLDYEDETAMRQIAWALGIDLPLMNDLCIRRTYPDPWMPPADTPPGVTE